jgi:tetratricopeptide (TPR) repeat protein
MSKRSRRIKKTGPHKSTYSFVKRKNHNSYLKNNALSAFLLKNSSYLVILVIFYLAFLLLTPLGTFSPWIAPSDHTGYYSITRIDAGDDAAYYSYLRSAFFDHDIDFFNEKGYYHFDTITPTGYSINYWSIGSAVLWSPFFLLGHAVALIYNFLGYQVSVDGYSFPYHVLTGIGSGLCVFLGLVLTFSLLKNYFSKNASLIATITLFLGTPLPYYTFIRQRMSHAGEFLVMTFFIYSWILYRSKYKNMLGSFLLGLSAGMLLTIRLNTGMFLLIPFLDFLVQAVGDFRKRNFGALKLMGRNMLVVLVTCMVVIVPQLVAWNTILGRSFPATSHVSFTLSNIFENITYVLVGRDWGVFITEPVWIFGLLGLAFFTKRDKRMGILFYLSVGVSLVICAGFLNEASFGHRFLLNCNIMLSFGVAALIDSIKMKKKVLVCSLISALFILWNYFLLVQYKVLMAYNDSSFALKALGNIPKIVFHDHAVLLRSTSFFKLIFSDAASLASYTDWFFLVLLPVLVLCLALALLGMLLWLFRARFEKSLMCMVTLTLCFFIFLNGLSLTLLKGKTKGEKYLRYKEAALPSLGRGNTGKALRYLETAKVLRAEMEGLPVAGEDILNRHLSSALSTQAVKLYESDKFQEALTLFSEAAVLNPDSDKVHRNLGILLYNSKEYKKALYHFQKSLELNPDQKRADTLRNLVRELGKRGE